MIDGEKLIRRLVAAGPETRRRLIAALAEDELRRLDKDWPAWVRIGQEPPAGTDWRIWLMLGGRGFGKTRAGAEWISQLARDHPGASIALVAATPDEARRVMVEGRSGLIAVATREERARMRWEPSRRRLVFAGGAEAIIYSGAHPDSLRGPEHHFAWCDELAKWRRAEDAWDNLMMGLRLGERPRALVTTTPRPLAVLKAIIGDGETARSGGATRDNPQLSAAAVASLERRYGNTRLGRQELGGELIDEVEAPLWPRKLIEECRSLDPPSPRPAPGQAGSTATRDERDCFRKVVVGVDPPASNEGTCGIVVCGLGHDGVAYVLADLSAGGLSPEGWARKTAAAAEAWGAQRVVAEANNGGRMVEAVLKGAGVAVPVRLVHAAEGKSARAAPVATLFEGKRARFAGSFPALEDELAGLSWDGGYEGPGRSPDRADAMVWAMTELMLGAEAAEPRIRRL